MADRAKMIVEIESLKRGSTTSAKGNNLTGLDVKGTWFKKDGVREPWQKFLNDYYDANAISEFERVGVGNKVLVLMERDGRFWKVISVKPAEEFQDNSQTEDDKQPVNSTQPPNQTATIVTPQPVAEPVSAVQTALKEAVKLMVEMLSAGIIKGTKATPQVVVEHVISTSDTLLEYLEGQIDSKPESDSSDLGDADPDDQIPDDDIPF